MKKYCDLLIKNGTIITDKEIVVANIAILKDMIVAVGDCSYFRAKKTFNASKLHILPGIIDGHVHFREPGATHKENLLSGSRSALLGGVTTICDMPNTKPPTINEVALDNKLEIAKNKLFIDYGFWLGATGKNNTQILKLQDKVGVAGIKLYMSETTGNLSHEGETSISHLLKESPRPVAFHAESQSLLDSRRDKFRTANVLSHSIWRDSIVAATSVLEIAKLSKLINKKSNILHLSSARELEVISKYRKFLFCEVTPQHLILSTPQCYEQLGTLAQMNPPIRDKKDNYALWQGIKNGLIDTIGSDHAPHTIKEKAIPYPDSPSGMPGCQTMLSLMIDGFTKNQISLTRLVSMMSTKVANILQLKDRGKIEIGFLPNLTIVDLKHQYTINNAKMASKCGWTPYDGMKVQGMAIATIIHGKIAMHHGRIIYEKGNGKPIR